MNRSQQILGRSWQKRTSKAMAEILGSFETSFPDQKDEDAGLRFRHGIKDVLNDVMRASVQELNDYQIEYRPLRLSVDNILSMTAEFLATVDRIEFTITDSVPSVKIFANESKARVLDAVRAEVGVGLLHTDGQSVILEIAGVRDCVNRVVPIMDRYKLTASVRKGYVSWRTQLVNLYTGRR